MEGVIPDDRQALPAGLVLQMTMARHALPSLVPTLGMAVRISDPSHNTTSHV